MRNFIKNLAPSSLKRVAGRSYLFWAFRSVVLGQGVWERYSNSFSDARRGFFSIFVAENCCKTILDFGCASGPNIRRIETDLPEKTFYFLGIDVSEDALKIARKNIRSSAIFAKSLTTKDLISVARNNKYQRVDLAIFDRVLTILNERDLLKIFQMISGCVRYIIIDDFYDLEEHNGEVWRARNYEKILSEFNYQLKTKIKSEHLATTCFHDNYAYLMVFESQAV